MAHPFKEDARKSSQAKLRNIQRATGGGVSKERGRKYGAPEDYNPEPSTSLSTHFLPHADSDYDSTGGYRTQGMTDFGESPETKTFRDSVDYPIQGRKRGGKTK